MGAENCEICHWVNARSRRVADEADGRDETLCPLDFLSAGQMRADQILRELVAPLAEGVQLTCLMDCCHSGTILDLPYSLVATEEDMEGVTRGVLPLMS